MSARSDLPLSAALPLLVRDAMNPQAIPDSAVRIVGLWRETLGSAADALVSALVSSRVDQAEYARRAHELLSTLGLAQAQIGALSTGDAPDDGASLPRQQPTDTDAASDPTVDPDAQADQPQQGASRETDETSPHTPETAGGSDGEPCESGSGSETMLRAGDARSYRPFTRAYDQEIGAEDLCEVGEIISLRQKLDQQLLSFASGRRALGKPSAAPAVGAPDAGVAV